MTGQKITILCKKALAALVLSVAFAPICASAYVVDSVQGPQKSPSLGQVYDRELSLLRRLGVSEQDPSLVLRAIEELENSSSQLERMQIARPSGRGGRGGRSGGIDTGGGTLVLTPEGPRLLDLFLHGEIRQGEDPIAEASMDTWAQDVLPTTRALREVGFDRITNSNSAVVEKAIAAVQLWAPGSPILGPKILRAVRRVPIYVFDGRFGLTGQRYFVPRNVFLPESRLRLGALYVEKFGTLVSRADLLALPGRHQVALIVHEALRHMQISHEAGFSNEAVQQLTALILRKPNPGETLDQVVFMKGPILAEFLSRSKTTLEVLSYSERMCRRYPKTGSHFCELPSAPAVSVFKNGLLLSHVKLWDQKQKRQTSQATQDFYDGINLSNSLVTLSVGEKLDRMSEDVLSVDRAVIGYSALDMDLKEFNEVGDVTSGSYQRLRRLFDELVESGAIIR